MSFYKRKEVIGRATLYLGDCLPVMAQFGNKEIDAIATDPPYGIGEAAGKNKSRSLKAVSKDFGFKEWDNCPPPLKYFIQMKRIAEFQVIFGGNYFPVEPSSCWLVWDKRNGNNDFADCELAWTNLGKAVRQIRYRWQGMLQENMKNKEERVHPTQKPVKVMEWCIEQIPLNPGAVILDPFMGSGSTGVAATNLGHKFIGVEMDEEYFDIACQRIEQAQRQLQLFQPVYQ